MKASEAKQCAANGVKEVTEIQIGLDGLALATAKSTRTLGPHPAATSIWRSPRRRSASRNKAKTWKDVNGKLPAIPIRVYGPPPTSGTRDCVQRADDVAGLRNQCRRWPR